MFVEGRTGYSFIWVVEAYLNQDGQAVPAAVIVGGNRASAPTSLSIQSGLITLTGLRVGGNDAMCCPSQPFTQVLSVQSDQLVDVSASTAAQAAAPAPTSTVAGALPRSPADLGSLKPGFTAQVLIPPPGLDPFASLQLSSVQSQLQTASVSTLEVLHTYPQSYDVGFTDPNFIGQFHMASAGVAGAISRQLYDDSAADLLKTFGTCAPTAAYCGRPASLPACPPIPA